MVLATLANKKDSILFAKKILNKAVEPFSIEDKEKESFAASWWGGVLHEGLQLQELCGFDDDDEL